MNRYTAFILPFALALGVEAHSMSANPPASASKSKSSKPTVHHASGKTASTKHSCCSISEAADNTPQPSATAQFAALSSDGVFVSTHEEPLKATFATKGAAVTVKAADGTECFGYEIKPTVATKNVIFVVHEFWGLNDYIKQEADKLSEELGVRVIALDLYDGKVATAREDAVKYMQANKPERSQAIIAAFQKYVGADAKIATIGWCFGGGWSHQASLAVGKQAVGCVIYYGMPEMDAAKLAAMNAPTLGIFAKQDKWITPEVASKFEAAVKAARKPIEIKMYDADHAFANPSNAKYGKDFAEDAHKAVIAFFKKCFA